MKITTIVESSANSVIEQLRDEIRAVVESDINEPLEEFVDNPEGFVQHLIKGMSRKTFIGFDTAWWKKTFDYFKYLEHEQKNSIFRDIVEDVHDKLETAEDAGVKILGIKEPKQ